MAIYAIVNKSAQIIRTVYYVNCNLNGEEDSNEKACKITDRIADKIHLSLKSGEPQSDWLLAQVLGYCPAKRTHKRNTRSDKYKEDKQNAITYVLNGGSYKRAAERYNVNEGSLRKWVSLNRKV